MLKELTVKSTSSDIGVVIQGAVHPVFTKEVIRSVRQYLPNAYIVLSTWEGSPEILGVDKQINNCDPGAPVLDKHTGQKNNLNRQIVSTINGVRFLKKIGKKYTLKLRTDTNLTSCGFLSYFDMFNDRVETFKVFQKRLVICNKYVRPSYVFPFHISDWAIFGLTTDVENLYDIPLEPESFTSWFDSHELMPEHFFHQFKNFRHRYCAEQYIWLQCLRKYYPIQFDNMFDFSNGNIAASNESLINNFVVVSDQMFGVQYMKFRTSSELCLSYRDWLDGYYQLFGKEYSIELPGKEITRRIKEKQKRSYKKYFQKCRSGEFNLKNLMKSVAHGIGYGGIVFFRHILTAVDKENTRILKVLGIPVFKVKQNCDPIMSFMIKYHKQFDRIALLEVATGEMTLLASNMNSVFNSPKTTAFIFYRNSAKQVFDIVTHFQYSTFLAEDLGLSKSHLPYDSGKGGIGIRFFFPSDFWTSFWDSDKTFVDFIKFKYGLKIAKIKKYDLSELEMLGAKKKLEDIGINSENFVLVCPRANSVQSFSDDFWESLIKKYRLNGYDVFIDDKLLAEKLGQKIDRVGSFETSLQDLLHIAANSKKIVALRSGLCEFLSQTGVPLDVYYPKDNCLYPHLKYFYQNYSCSQYDLPSKVREIVVEN